MAKIYHGAGVIYRVYDSAGTYTWQKPVGLSALTILVVGAGGGGGSGRVGAPNTERYGGGSGATAGRVLVSMFGATVAALANSYTVTVGAGGVGGAAVSAPDTNGNDGSAGGDSSFGSLLIAKGGGGGKGGTQTSSAGGTAPVAGMNTPSSVLWSFSGGNGAPAGFTGGGFNSFAGSNVSGGGGRITASNLLSTSGGGGGITLPNGFAQPGPAGSSTAGTNGSSGTPNLNTPPFSAFRGTLSDFDFPKLFGTAASGGAPGDAAGTVNGGNGAKPATPGAGGSGGGGATNGAASGAGGNGADGLVVIVEYYGLTTT